MHGFSRFGNISVEALFMDCCQKNYKSTTISLFVIQINGKYHLKRSRTIFVVGVNNPHARKITERTFSQHRTFKIKKYIYSGDTNF